jgi:hypothetical protein
MKHGVERFLGEVRLGSKPVEGPSTVTAPPDPMLSAGLEGFCGLANGPNILPPTIFCTDLTDGDEDVSVTVVIRKLLALFLSPGEDVFRMWMDLSPWVLGRGDHPLIGDTLNGLPCFPGEIRKLKASGSMSSIAFMAGEKGCTVPAWSCSPLDRGVAICDGIKFTRSSARRGEHANAPAEKIGPCCCMSQDALARRGVIVGLSGVIVSPGGGSGYR